METSPEKPPIDFGPAIDVAGASKRAVENFDKSAGESGAASGKVKRKPNKKSNKTKGNGVYSEESAPGVVPPPETEKSFVSRETVERAIASLIQIIDDSVQKAVGGRAIDISGDEALARVYREKVAVKSDEKEQISTLSADVCEQYGLLGQHAALLFLFVFVTTYVTRVGLTIRSLNILAEDKKKILGK